LQLQEALAQAKNPKYGVVPRGFSVEKSVGRPWYEREGVNRAKLDDLIRNAASGGQGGPLQKASGGAVSYGSRSSDGRARTGGSGAEEKAQRLNSVQRAIASLRRTAEEHGVYKPQLSNMIRQITPDMPREQSSLYAKNILSEDLIDISERLARNKRAIPILQGLERGIKADKGKKVVGELRRALRDYAINGG
jgi:hypothetical protein